MRPGDAEDRDLVAQTLAGRRGAFGALVRRHHRAVYSIAYRTTRDTDVASDLAQETFLRAFRGLKGFDVTRPFSPWLYRIAANLSLKWVQRKVPATVSLEASQHAPSAFSSREPSPEDAAVEAERNELLWSAVSSLAPQYRDVIVLRHGEGLAYEEIADRLGISLANVKTRLFRGRRQLREILVGQEA